MGIGLIQDKTTEYLQKLLAPFDKPVDFIEFLPDVMVAVGNAMELYKACNNKMNDFTTTNKKKVRPDVLVYCRDVLVIMGEDKAANSTLATAAADLDYYFKFWNMLAFDELLVFAFAAVGSQIQFYYFHVVESSTTPKRERIGGVLSLGTEVKRNNYLAIKYYSDY
ncbi:hypothetical protein RhiirC2_785460 [Rhizophagus irregularis]|uniref:Crinkler family protein n=1 Tax=Rhizophagus irregularis TaxID=588596 RepID=A0A2N1MWE4_9GLOM|nr:hypothetical protein RhiirC2_785460 [Rhizophagus irregularis]